MGRRARLDAAAARRGARHRLRHCHPALQWSTPAEPRDGGPDRRPDRRRRLGPVLARGTGAHEELSAGQDLESWHRIDKSTCLVLIRTMVKPLTRRRRLYLRRELHKIRGAVEAARILSEAVATDQLGPDRDHRRAPRAIASLLVLVDERLQRLRRAARRPSASQERPPEKSTSRPGAPRTSECSLPVHGSGT